MKKRIYITLLLFIWLFGLFAQSQSFASGIEEKKLQVLQIWGWEKLVQKIDTISKKIAEKSQESTDFYKKIIVKIGVLKKKYSQKTDTKSKKIVIILSYLHAKIFKESEGGYVRILERFQKVESNKYQKKASSRVNKIKKQKYQRIYIKK